MPEHLVQQGDCISSIAHEYGFYWRTIWEDPRNAELAAKRGDPNILLPGDVVFIPNKVQREESIQTEKQHTFCLGGTPSVLRIRLLKWGVPRAALDYRLEIEGTLTQGKTSASGLIEARIPCDARNGKITLLCGDTVEEYPLQIGSMSPAAEISGAALRLHNLGYALDPVGESDKIDPRFAGALRSFQKSHNLEPTGELNEATTSRIVEVYGA
jgi:hypothetical protein